MRKSVELGDNLVKKGKEEFVNLKCNHCGTTSHKKILGKYSTVKSNDDITNNNFHVAWDAGSVYELLECDACDGIILREFYYHSEFPEESDSKILYPDGPKRILGMSKAVERAYRSALKVRSDANAYAALLGRVLDIICQEKSAEGDTLSKRLQDLAKKDVIPKPIADLAHQLRGFRNIAAHAELGELKKGEIEILDDLCSAILQYVYQGPYLIMIANQRLKKLKK